MPFNHSLDDDTAGLLGVTLGSDVVGIVHCKLQNTYIAIDIHTIVGMLILYSYHVLLELELGVFMLDDKVDISSVTMDPSIVVCTTVSVECNTVDCSVLAIHIE